MGASYARSLDMILALMWPLLAGAAVLAGPIVAVLFVAWLVKRIGLGADPRIEDAAHAIRLAEEAEEGCMRVTGVINAGIMNMSPVVLCVEIGSDDADAGRCTVRIAGFAKEGLISQHAAEKGVAKLAEVLNMLKA